jgi:WhiB family redox-sensing transcriptional regulator
MPNWQTMSTLLAGIPDLHGARCKGRADLYDATIGVSPVDGRPTRDELEKARATALHLCVTCPALDPCRVWLDGQRPTRRPRGVVAGRVVNAGNA